MMHHDLVLPTDTADHVTVLWPKKKDKKEPEKWDAVIVNDSRDATVPITIKERDDREKMYQLR